MKALAGKPHQGSANRKIHHRVHWPLKNAPCTDSDRQIPMIQPKTICPCDGGCPRCTPVIQPKIICGQRTVPGDINLQIQNLQGRGQPLSFATVNYFQRRFGHDFSQIRIHNDLNANRSAQKLNARAYTHGQHIVFGQGQYDPQTRSGKKLLAHELVHTIQQGGANPVNDEAKSVEKIQGADAKQIIQPSPLSQDLATRVAMLDFADEQDRNRFWGNVWSIGSCHDPEALYIIEQALRINPPQDARDVTPIRTQLGTAAIAASLSVPADIDQALVIAVSRATQVRGGTPTRHGIRDLLQHATINCPTLQYLHTQYSSGELGRDFGSNYSRSYLTAHLIPGLARRMSVCTRPAETETEPARETATEPESPSPALATPGREGDPRTSFYSHTISISESRGPSPAPRQIRYMIEYNRFHRGEQGAYVLYIQHVTADAGSGDQHFSYPGYLGIGSDLTVVPERENIVLNYVLDDILESAHAHGAEGLWSVFLASRETIRGTRAYEINNPNDLRAPIGVRLNRSWALETGAAPHGQMPGGQSPEEYGLAEYTDERHEASMAWLESEYGSSVRGHGEDFELHGLHHLDYDIVRLARGRQYWILDFRRSVIDPSRAPARAETRRLLEFHQGRAGAPVLAGTEAASQLRPLLGVEGVGDHTVLHLWENEFLANYGQWPRRRGGLAALLGNRMGCERRQAMARRLVSRISAQMEAQTADATTVRPPQRDLVPTEPGGRLEFAQGLRSRLGLQGPSDRVLTGFWERLTVAQEDEDYIEELNQLGLVRSYMHNLRFPDQRPSELSNPRAIRINDFSHYGTGVDLHNARQNIWNHMFRVHAVDPQFFAAVLQFCHALHAMGVRRLFTAGHYRSPLSPNDSHSRGRAIDITGFGFGAAHNLRLSNDDDQTAWNDTVSLLPDGRTYREAMLEISQLMSRYFSWIGGPGRDQRHNDHFHCEISRGRGERFQYLPATPLDPHPETRR